jgi:hypothetical protein
MGLAAKDDSLLCLFLDRLHIHHYWIEEGPA